MSDTQWIILAAFLVYAALSLTIISRTLLKIHADLNRDQVRERAS